MATTINLKPNVARKQRRPLRLWQRVLEPGHNLTYTLIGSLQGAAQSTKPILCKGRVLQNLADNKL